MTELQKEILWVFKHFAEICEKNDLRYFAGAGTLIGAVRHKGFIPWDDDLDVIMPLNDYEKLIEILTHESVNNLQIFNGLNAKVSDGQFIKLHKVDTMFTPLEFLPYPDSYFGVFIDIFPCIGTPQRTSTRANFQNKIDSLLVMLHQKRIYNYGSRSAEELQNRYLTLRNKYSFDNSTFVQVGALPTNVPSKSFTYSRSGFDSYTDVDFEDTTIRVPCGYDEQLRRSYGNYLKPPSESERVAKHQRDSVLDLHKSYETYANEARKSHLLKPYRDLFREKYDILNRIPPLEARIKLEVERVQEEVANVEMLSRRLSQETDSRILLAVRKKLIKITRKLNRLGKKPDITNR